MTIFRKREAPSRLNDQAQQRLSWFAKQVEPPDEQLEPEESFAAKNPPKKRKSGTHFFPSRTPFRLLFKFDYSDGLILLSSHRRAHSDDL